MEILHDPAALRAACDEVRAAGRKVALVPTMGALHLGHFSLVEASKPDAFRVVTIFVNPLQFGEGEDLDRYPRTLEADAAGCRERGVSVVFAPPPDAVFPDGFQTQVEVAGLTRHLEGAHRPGHFRGVTTIVTKLFGMVGPCDAYFGQKDYQQLAVIRRMTADLNLPVKVHGQPIVREPDGLALSSRNRYLSEKERSRAQSISRGIFTAEKAWRAGERKVGKLVALMRAEVDRHCDSVDYVAAADPDTLEVHPDDATPSWVVLLVAAHVGATRLIDNRVLG